MVETKMKSTVQVTQFADWKPSWRKKHKKVANYDSRYSKNRKWNWFRVSVQELSQQKKIGTLRQEGEVTSHVTIFTAAKEEHKRMEEAGTFDEYKKQCEKEANRRNVIMEAIEKQNPQSTPNSSQNNNVRSKKRKRNQSSKGDRRVSLVKKIRKYLEELQGLQIHSMIKIWDMEKVFLHMEAGNVIAHDKGDGVTEAHVKVSDSKSPTTSQEGGSPLRAIPSFPRYGHNYYPPHNFMDVSTRGMHVYMPSLSLAGHAQPTAGALPGSNMNLQAGVQSGFNSLASAGFQYGCPPNWDVAPPHSFMYGQHPVPTGFCAEQSSPVSTKRRKVDLSTPPTKASNRHSQRCGSCGESGHKRPTCPYADDKSKKRSHRKKNPDSHKVSEKTDSACTIEAKEGETSTSQHTAQHIACRDGGCGQCSTCVAESNSSDESCSDDETFSSSLTEGNTNRTDSSDDGRTASDSDSDEEFSDFEDDEVITESSTFRAPLVKATSDPNVQGHVSNRSVTSPSASLRLSHSDSPPMSENGLPTQVFSVKNEEKPGGEKSPLLDLLCASEEISQEVNGTENYSTRNSLMSFVTQSGFQYDHRAAMRNTMSCTADAMLYPPHQLGYASSAAPIPLGGRSSLDRNEDQLASVLLSRGLSLS